MNSVFYFSVDRTADYVRPPFHPPQDYPEFSGLFDAFDAQNRVYAMVRNLFIAARYDADNIGTRRWNPFRGLVGNGELVVIKPNLVHQEEGRTIGKQCITTNACLLRPVLDYLFLLQAADGITFRTIVGDVPVQTAVWEEMVASGGFTALIEYYRQCHPFDLQLLDLRQEVAVRKNDFIVSRSRQKGDPLGYTTVHLEHSYLNEIIDQYRKFSVLDYDGEQTTSHHARKGYHYYSIANTVLSCDLFINVPKIKTHQKAGVTLALKNLVGVNGDKSWIPHYRMGASSQGCDEFSEEYVLLKYVYTGIRRLLQERSRLLWDMGKWGHNRIVLPLVRYAARSRRARQGTGVDSPANPLITDGAWYGNDTLWRPILDLNNLLLFSDKHGVPREGPPRRCLCLGDGIVAGEGDGPLNATPKAAGLITLSENPVVHDVGCARLMGFDWRKIAQLKNATTLHNGLFFDGDTRQLSIVSCDATGSARALEYAQMPNLGFRPPPGWAEHVEIESRAASDATDKIGNAKDAR